MASAASSPFGDLLKRYRATAGLTQDELAERAQLSARTISNLERGVKHRPHAYTVQRLVRALDLAAEEQARLEAAGRPFGLPSLGKEGWDACVAPARQQERGTNGPPLPPPHLPAHRTAPVGGEATEAPGYPELPTPLTPLLGCDGDVARASALLREGARLLTLTGPGGVGKTRLGLQVAAESRALFADGVVFVALAPLVDAGLVLLTVAQALGLRETSGRALGEMLQRAVRGRRLLLLLDNCEHVLSGASAVAALLEGCPQLVMLATSRAPLRVRGPACARKRLRSRLCSQASRYSAAEHGANTRRAAAHWRTTILRRASTWCRYSVGPPLDADAARGTPRDHPTNSATAHHTPAPGAARVVATAPPVVR